MAHSGRKKHNCQKTTQLAGQYLNKMGAVNCLLDVAPQREYKMNYYLVFEANLLRMFRGGTHLSLGKGD